MDRRRHQGTRLPLAAILATAGWLIGAERPASAADWYEPFPIDYALVDDQQGPDGLWTCAWTGYGAVGTESGDDGLVMQLSPMASTVASETHSSLLLSTATFRDFRVEADVRTVAQLRAGTPNAWEVAWLVFRAANAGNFYYFIFKPNGAEMGRLLNGADQAILATTTSPRLTVGGWNHWAVEVVGNRFRFFVDGALVMEHVDRNMPAVLAAGGVGLYTEDATVQFDNVRVTPKKKRRLHH